MISLPKEWKIYTNSIRDRCRDLIDHKIWGGIELHQFEAWRQNFKTDAEKYFCACLLDSLIYRSNQQTYSLINQTLYKNLNNLFRILGEKDLQDFPDCLNNKSCDPYVRLVPAITSSSPVTKSSNEILRFMKRHFLICEKWIINPWKIGDELKKGVKAFVFIDDFLGTGHQFEDVILDAALQDIIEKNLVVYAPLVAHSGGVDYLNNSYPNLKITHAELLDKEVHSFFKNYFSSEVDIAKTFYVDMLSTRGLTLSVGHQFGYGDLELTYAFEHAAPDNSLHVFHKRSNSWVPLFNR